MTVNGTSYPIQATYNDNGQVTSQTYPTGEVVTPGYSSTGWLLSLSTQIGSTVPRWPRTWPILAWREQPEITTMNLGNGEYTYSASYDTGMRLTAASLSVASSGTQLYQTQPVYDAASNVVSVQTSIAGATDTQQFCYDSLNRLTWAGASGTPPCAS